MKFARFHHGTRPQVELTPTVRLWILRLLVPLGGYRAFTNHHGFTNDPLAHTLGLGAWVDLEDRSFDLKLVRAELRKQYQAAERRVRKSSPSDCLARNVARLSTLVGLSPTDCRILEFVVLHNNDRTLDDTADMLGELTSVKVFGSLSALLELPEPQVRAALSGSGVLAKSGLVSINRSGAITLRGKLELLSDDFADHMLSSEADPVRLLRNSVPLAMPTELSLGDFPHMAQALANLLPYLKHAKATGRTGVNAYLHGVPGTGKSQFAKALAHALGCELFEVASEDADGDPVQGDTRLRAYLRLCRHARAPARSPRGHSRCTPAGAHGRTHGWL